MGQSRAGQPQFGPGPARRLWKRPEAGQDPEGRSAGQDPSGQEHPQRSRARRDRNQHPQAARTRLEHRRGPAAAGELHAGGQLHPLSRDLHPRARRTGGWYGHRNAGAVRTGRDRGRLGRSWGGPG